MMPWKGTLEKKAVAISSLHAEALPDQFEFSFVAKNASNEEIADQGSVSYVISDDQGKTIYESNFNVTKSDFQSISLEGTTHKEMVWDLAYASLPQISVPTKNLSITVTFRTESGGDTQSTAVALPSVLEHLSPLYYEVAEPKEFASMFEKGEVSAAIAYEPYVSLLISNSSLKALLRSEDIWPGHPYYVLTFDRQWAETNPDLAMRMIKVHQVATDWINHAKSDNQSQDYSALIQMTKGVLNWNESVLRSAVDHIQYTSGMDESAMNYYERYTDGYISEGLIQSSMITSLGYKDSADFIHREVNTTLVNESEGIQESSTILGTVRLGFVSNNIHQMARAVAMNTSLWGGKTLYERYGLNVIMPQPNGYNSSGAVAGVGFGSKEIDAGYLGSCSTILDRAVYGINAFIACEASGEGTALIVNSSINGFPDLSGCTVATPGPNTIQHLMLRDLAEREWFSLQERPKGT